MPVTKQDFEAAMKKILEHKQTLFSTFFTTIAHQGTYAKALEMPTADAKAKDAKKTAIEAAIRADFTEAKIAEAFLQGLRTIGLNPDITGKLVIKAAPNNTIADDKVDFIKLLSDASLIKDLQKFAIMVYADKNHANKDDLIGDFANKDSVMTFMQKLIATLKYYLVLAPKSKIGTQNSKKKATQEMEVLNEKFAIAKGAKAMNSHAETMKKRLENDKNIKGLIS